MASDVIAGPDVGVRVQVGIDAVVVAHHQVCVRRLEPDGRVRTERFRVPPTLDGLSTLSRRLAEFPEVTAVAEPTSIGGDRGRRADVDDMAAARSGAR